MKSIIKIKVTSLDTDEIIELGVHEAVETINRLIKQNRYWLYLDGSAKHPNLLTIEMLLKAKKINLNNAIIGG